MPWRGRNERPCRVTGYTAVASLVNYFGGRAVRRPVWRVGLARSPSSNRGRTLALVGGPGIGAWHTKPIQIDSPGCRGWVLVWSGLFQSSVEAIASSSLRDVEG